MGVILPGTMFTKQVSRRDGQSRSPIVAAEAQQAEPTRTKTWSRARSEVFVRHSSPMGARRLANPAGPTPPGRAHRICIVGSCSEAEGLTKTKDGPLCREHLRMWKRR
jgi:hypothetical protein